MINIKNMNQLNFLLCMLSIFMVSSVLFLDGFFQVSKTQIQRTEEQLLDNIKVNMLDEYRLEPPSVKYDQVVLMIIDALRIDYPNATNMPFAYEQACNNLQIKVDIPTVTMPRLKTITTGAISKFIDIVLNLGQTTKLDDSILHRLAEKNKKSVFAGDHTWIQLFPTQFLRAAANTDSFFVKDFYEGDLNVTKALQEELQRSDWHLMVLHYLGLDHIGHVEGSHSDKIYNKLYEMDTVIKYITANANINRLLLLTGDHGMRNGGSHGGTDKEELYVPLMAFQKNCDIKKRSFTEYRQIDIAATLSVLLDIKIPHTSIGCLIPELLEIYSKKDQLYLFYYNALHLMGQLRTKLNSADIENKDYLTWFEYAKTSHKEFISSQSKSVLSYEKAKQSYIRLSQKISQVLSESLVEYDMPQIFIALLLTTLSAIKLLMNVLLVADPNSAQTNHFTWHKVVLFLVFTNFINLIIRFFDILNTRSIIRSIILTSHVTISIYFAFDVFKMIIALIILPVIRNRKVMMKLSIPLFSLVLFLCHSLSLISTSFIEEEHQTWYYFTPSLLIFLILQNFYHDVKNVWQKHKPIDIVLHEFWNIRHICIVLLFLIGCRRLNQTGDKWRDVIDVGDILSRKENHLLLTLTLLAGLTLLLLLLKKHNSTLELVFCFSALTCVFLHHQMTHYSLLILVLFWASLIGTQTRRLSMLYKRSKFGYGNDKNRVQFLETNLTSSFLLSALLHRPHNVILLPALIYTLKNSYLLCDNLHIKDNRVYRRSYVLVLKTVLTIFVANMFYFFQGNSNSLATIDLNPGYIGLSSYNPFVVGFLITLNTYCAPINSFLYLMWHMFSTQKNVLPLRQEKEQSNVQLVASTDELYLVYSLFTVSTIMPVSLYWCLLVGFRYHLFIYSVFAPKAFYELFNLIVFYIMFIVTNVYFRMFLK